MEAHSERIDGALVFFINGRLDAFGASKLDEWVKESVHDDDRELVLDLTACPYLSSGGIRIFLTLKKEMKRRNGRFILTGVQEYPGKVLDMAGFTTVMEIFPTTDIAVENIRKFRKDPTLFSEIFHKTIVEKGVHVTIEPGISPAPPSLKITGDLDNVLFARLTAKDIHRRKFSEIAYSLGLGALGASVDEAMPLLGEMIALHGSMVWLPTDGHNTPDFLTLQQMDGDVVVYTGFAITLDGQFDEYLTVDCREAPAISLTDLYRLIFSLARNRKKEFRGVIAVAIWGVVDGVASTGIKKSPIRSQAPTGGVSIMSPAKLSEWIASDTSFSYKGDTLVGFGIGIDLTHDLSAYDPGNLHALSYINPSNKGSKDMYLHTHGVIFRNVPYDPSLDLNTRIKKIVEEGEFVDMRHLLDSTRISKAKVGVSYIQSIVREK